MKTHGERESYNISYPIGNMDRNCKSNKGTPDSLRRMEAEKEMTTAELRI